MRFFTSDTHFHHYNIIRYCGRPFKDQYHMNEILIANWNSVVGEGDTIYHLGDFAMGGVGRMTEIMQRLNGKKRFLKMGNHDKNKNRFKAAGFDAVIRGDSRTDLTIGGDIRVQLSHYPYKKQFNDGVEQKSRRWEQAPDDDGGILLCGHIHEKWKVNGRMINVGVDVWDFTPVSEDQLVQFIKDNNIRSLK
jgi:calcineurin-like phosphoesterase family protein